MDQHIISAWVLRAFGRPVGRKRFLHVYDKALDSYSDVSVDDFLAETDAHSIAVEQGLARIEGPASQVARRLAKLTKLLPPGLYAIVGPDDPVQTAGPALTDQGVFQGMRLLVSEHQVPSPSRHDRQALASYAALIYQRAPKLEAALVEFGLVYDQAAQAALDRLMPGTWSGLLPRDVSARRARMLLAAEDIGGELARASWWIVRAGRGEAFVLGDNPVATTISLGHDDSWRPILSSETYVVAIPLGPTLALIMAPRAIIPISGIVNVEQALPAINRLLWRSAARFVLARDRHELDQAMPGADEPVRRSTIPVDYGADRVARAATGNVISIVSGIQWRLVAGPWQRWEACRLVFGYVPFASEDRGTVVGPPGHG